MICFLRLLLLTAPPLGGSRNSRRNILRLEKEEHPTERQGEKVNPWGNCPLGSRGGNWLVNHEPKALEPNRQICPPRLVRSHHERFGADRSVSIQKW
jgi:hypothetical protein